MQGLDVKLEDLERIVEGDNESGNSKLRFELSSEDNVNWIRATNGHSRKDFDALKLHIPLNATDNQLPSPCVHGSRLWNWQSIKQKGLLAGGLKGRRYRNEVHFACEEPGGKRAISGMRKDCDLAIWLDLKKALQDGIPFYVSPKNGVILSPGNDEGCIPSKYFSKVLDLRTSPPTDLLINLPDERKDNSAEQ